MMGSPDNEAERDRDEQRHPVLISKPFRIGKYEVTQAQWEAVLGQNPASFKVANNRHFPVECVSWLECEKLCETIGLRLPSEAEWEYAARAGTVTPFHLGNDITTDQVNYNGNYPYVGGMTGEYRNKTLQVGTLPNANAWGGCDFHGNVREWCLDWYQESLREATDPDGPRGGQMRVHRGGSWELGARDCRAAHRRSSKPDSRSRQVGVRICFGYK